MIPPLLHTAHSIGHSMEPEQSFPSYYERSFDMPKGQMTDIGTLRQIVLLSCKSAFLRFTKLASVFLFSGLALNSNALAMPKGTSDAELVEKLKGFKSASITTPGGIRIHYVEGGQGEPLILLPGWPETWWEYHKIMPVLATHFHVIAVDIRGMGGSSKPQGGYDKKTMAKDIYALVSQRGFKKVNIAGHDIGAMVGFAFAANYPDAIQKLALLDAPHPNENTMNRPGLPAVGTFGAKIDEDHPIYPWWFAFHQVKGLPERLLAGRESTYINFLLDYLTKDSTSISEFDRKVYAANYSISSGNAWYQSFPQDVLDLKQYQTVKVPVLGLGSLAYEYLKLTLPPIASNVKVVRIGNSGHFIVEEQPEVTAQHLIEFFGTP